ncbi:transcriptional regulator GcvA [Flexibacterium corallicola]|uniref:transcriptional regulator GcvA n=1 Tax=Flexibacterium corallicola TaxID=3037259 RepID=UPI00286EFC82|nr:transcriptional regulator GcvA [Pseudovibrio sp. M1P-2-3]
MRYKLPPLNTFRAFEAVARHLSFAKAAEEMNLTPSALSYQIKTLEEQLGVQLFKRMNRAIDLTTSGRQLLPGVEGGLHSFSEAVARVTGKPEDSILLISTGPAMASKLLVPRIYRFMDENPDIELRISASFNLVDFSRDEVDLALRFGKGPYPDLHAEKLARETMTPLCNPQIAKKLQTPADLKNFTLLHDETTLVLPETISWKQWLEQSGLGRVSWAEKGLRFSHADHALNAAMEGAGVWIGRHVLAANDVRLGHLIAPFSLQLEHQACYWLIGQEKTFQTTKAKCFHDWLRAELETLVPDLACP